MARDDDENEKTAPESNGRAKNIVQGMGSLTLQNLATSLLGFVFIAALLHKQFLPEIQYGIYSAVLVTVNIGAAFAGFALNLSAARYISSLKEENEELAWVAAKKILYLSILLTVVVTSIYLASAPLFSEYFTRSKSWTWAFILGGGWLFANSISNTFQGMIQGLKSYVRLAKILFSTRLTMVVLTIAALFFYHSVSVPLAAWILFNALIIIWIFSMFGRKILASSGVFSYSTILRYSAPLGVAGIISIFATSSDTVVVGGFLNTVSLGVYTAAITISSVLGVVVLTPLTIVLLPEISSSREHGDISYGVRLSLRYVTLAILPASLLVAAVPLQLLDLFSSGGVYVAGAFTLETIAFFYSFLAVQSVLLVLLQGIGKTIQVIIVGALTAVTDIGLALILVPHFGLAGAVASKAAVSIDGMVAAIYFSRMYMNKLDSWKFYLKGIFCAAIPFAAVLLLTYFISARLVTLVPYALIFAAIFLACARGTRLISDEDRAFLSHILPRQLQKLASLV